jgi:biotin carboxylase
MHQQDSAPTEASRKTILVVGTNAGQADLIRYMRTRGWRVLACSKLADEPGRELCDEFFQVDVRDVERVVALAHARDVDLVYSVSSDTTNGTAVKVAEALGLPHFHSSELIRILDNKHKLREILNEHGISVVKFRHAATLEDASGWSHYPCFVKPDASQGQRGISKVDRREDLEAAFQAAKAVGGANSSVIIEEFLAGIEIPFNVLVKDGGIVFCEPNERLFISEAFIGLAGGHVHPCYNVPAEQQQAAHELVCALIELLRIDNGPLYVQVMVTKDGPKVVEIGPRVDGGHLWRLFAAAGHPDYIDLTMRVLLREPLPLPRPRNGEAPRCELIFYRAPTGYLFAAANHPIPEDALYSEYRYHDGEVIKPVNGKFEVVGYYVRAVDTEESTKYAANVR